MPEQSGVEHIHADATVCGLPLHLHRARHIGGDKRHRGDNAQPDVVRGKMHQHARDSDNGQTK